MAAAVAFARDLVNEPAGTMTPRRLAEIAAQVAEDEGLAFSVLDEVAIVNEGLGGLAGVAQGSDEPARLIELVYEPAGEAQATIALVGKGITFDSGGLSIKTAEGMETMKTDKSGAAAVLAAMSAIPSLAPNVKVIAIIPASENMPGGSAIKPGDVLKIRNGKTVEVLNTDAEGRLVLADGLSLAVEAGADVILDLATLTGACVVALGRKIAGLMGNDKAWMDKVQEAAERAGESVWQLPLPDEYRKLIDSEVADVKNIGGGRYAGRFDGRAVPEGVRRRRGVGPPRHRRPGPQRGRRGLRHQGRDRLRGPHHPGGGDGLRPVGSGVRKRIEAARPRGDDRAASRAVEAQPATLSSTGGAMRAATAAANAARSDARGAAIRRAPGGHAVLRARGRGRRRPGWRGRRPDRRP